MPTYAYRCTACGHEFDAVQRFSDEPIEDCPVCGAHVRRLIQPVGVVFKGSGWYINDSRKSSGESTTATAKPTKETKDVAKDGADTPDSTGPSPKTEPVVEKATPVKAAT